MIERTNLMNVKRSSLTTVVAEAPAAIPIGSRPGQQVIRTIDRHTLTPLIRQALASQSVEIIDWRSEQIESGVGNGHNDTAVYRFSGQAWTPAGRQPWALILKMISSRFGESPSGAHYWKREVEAYNSRLLAHLPGNLAAPRCFAVDEEPGVGCLLWLEAVNETVDRQWSAASYAVAARHLGQFNGAYAAAGHLPAEAWLCQTPPYSAAEAGAFINQLRRQADHPVVERVFPGEIVGQVLAVWQRHHRCRQALDQLPQTLCHYDAFRRNLFIQRDSHGSDRTVAIDWALAGRGAVGEDAGALTFLSLLFIEAERLSLSELDQIVFTSYLQGLWEQGWRGPAAPVRLGYTAHITLRWLELVKNAMPLLMDEHHHDYIATVIGRGYQARDFMDSFAALSRFVLAIAAEAQTLMETGAVESL